MLSAEEKKELWLKPALEHFESVRDRIEEGIEKNRKGYCKLRFVDGEGNPIVGKKVRIQQTGHDFLYGANIFMLDEFEDEKINALYRESFKKYFNAATVPFYWDGLEPEKGKPRYDKHSPKVYRRPAPELCVEYCEENDVLPKLHCLIYDKFTPDWLPKKDMAAMEKLYEERFRQISERYAGRLFEFEVMNELLCESGWTTQSVISDKHDLIEWGFDLARKYFPDETLVINEANQIIELGDQDFRNRYYLLVENSLRAGADIDKIALQYHCFLGATTTNDAEYEKAIRNDYKRFFHADAILRGLDVMETLGLPMEFSEITVPTFGETEEDEALQADLLEILYTTVFSHRTVDAMVYWNLPDGYAYNAAGRVWNENKVRGGLFHHDMTPKKAAERLYDLFHKKWHTDLELVTDEGGYVDFRGFFGEYDVSLGDSVSGIEIYRGEDNTFEITV